MTIVLGNEQAVRSQFDRLVQPADSSLIQWFWYIAILDMLSYKRSVMSVAIMIGGIVPMYLFIVVPLDRFRAWELRHSRR